MASSAHQVDALRQVFFSSVSHEPFSLFHHSVLICLDCFSVMMYCICKAASMQAKQVLRFNNRRFGASNMQRK